MSWQDITFAVAQVAFVVSLWPSIRDRIHKPSRGTCAIAMLALVGILVAQLTLHLYLAALVTIVEFLEYDVLIVQVRRGRSVPPVEIWRQPINVGDAAVLSDQERLALMQCWQKLFDGRR